MRPKGVPSLDPDAPVVVGALGGSGTRVVGEILIRSGVHLGGSLNTANDSVTATVLFNRPSWARRSTHDDQVECFRRLRRMLLQEQVTLGDLVAFGWAAARPGHTEGVVRRLRYAARYRRERGPGPARAWGWKEPNSHLFLPVLAEVFPSLRFVYVARHPLDMAFSPNLNQLGNWGWLHGVGPDGDDDAVARAQLDFWIGATEKIRIVGPELLGDRFRMLSFEELVDEPRETTRALREFIDLPADEGELDTLAALPRRPSSHGRYRDHDLSVFRPDQIDAVRELWGEV